MIFQTSRLVGCVGSMEATQILYKDYNKAHIQGLIVKPTRIL